MGKRKREDKFLFSIIEFGVVLFAFGYAYSTVRPVVMKYGLATAFALIVLFIGQVAMRKYLSTGRTAQAIAPQSKLPSALDQLNPSNTPGFEISLDTSPDSLLNQFRAVDWFQFEKAMVVLYEALEHKVTRRGGANPDGGIDLIIEKDGSSTAIQCKQWRTREVGVRTVREFL